MPLKHDRLCLQEITNYAINGKQETYFLRNYEKRNEYRDLKLTYVREL